MCTNEGRKREAADVQGADCWLPPGQPMSIKLLTRPDAPRRVASAPSTLSLLNRIEKKPLIARVARDDADATQASLVPATPLPAFLLPSTVSDACLPYRTGTQSGRVGPTRTPRGQQSQPKRGRGGRGGAAPRAKKPKTAEDLDKELDAFMVDADTMQPSSAGDTSIVDVEMA